MAWLKIKQIRSRIGAIPKHRATLDALGLRKHQSTVIKPDSPIVRGMIKQVRHLVEVSEIDKPEIGGPGA